MCDSNNYFFHTLPVMQDDTDVSTSLSNVVPQPTVVIRGSMQDPKEAYLIIEREISADTA